MWGKIPVREIKGNLEILRKHLLGNLYIQVVHFLTIKMKGITFFSFIYETIIEIGEAKKCSLTGKHGQLENDA